MLLSLASYLDTPQSQATYVRIDFVADTRLRKAERDFLSNPSADSLITYWSEYQRIHQTIELSIVPPNLFNHPDIRQFLNLGQQAWQRCTMFGHRLEQLFKKLYLVCHNQLFITGWAPPGEQVEGSSPALTGLDLRRVFWLPDTSQKTGRFICHVGHNHFFTIAIPYTIFKNLFLPLNQCPVCNLDINIIEFLNRLTGNRHDPRHMHRPDVHSLITIQADCMNDEYVIENEHDIELLSLLRDPSSGWLMLPLPLVLDRAAEWTPMDSEQAMARTLRLGQTRTFPEIPIEQAFVTVNQAFEIPGLEGNGIPYFIE